MGYERIYNDEFCCLTKEDGKVVLEIYKAGYDIQQFNKEVLSKMPRVQVTDFAALNEAFNHVPVKGIVLGKIIPIVEISVSKDLLEAYAQINMTESELHNTPIERLKETIELELDKKEIQFRLDLESALKQFNLNEKLLVARGVPPQKGKDAVIKMYKIQESKPTLNKEGGVDHYELNVINKIHADEWLGERIEPTPGIPGKNIFGNEMKAIDGEQLQLDYDRQSVKARISDDYKKTVLYAKHNGAVVYHESTISVQNSIEVNGNVEFATGNIDFNGFVDITGTVEDNFKVVADENIQIMGEMGVGACGRIESRKGDVYIRGGVAGKNMAYIKARNNIYVKFASDCTLECEGTVNIGYYAMNCHIKAKEVIFESSDSRLIGGETVADMKVVVSELGSRSSTETRVSVIGFDKENLRRDYNRLYEGIDAIKKKISMLTAKKSTFEGKELTREAEITYDKVCDELLKTKKNLNVLYDTQKRYVGYLKTKGSGEIRIGKAYFSNTHIKIGQLSYEVNEDYKSPAVFFLEDNVLKKE